MLSEKCDNNIIEENVENMATDLEDPPDGNNMFHFAGNHEVDNPNDFILLEQVNLSFIEDNCELTNIDSYNYNANVNLLNNKKQSESESCMLQENPDLSSFSTLLETGEFDRILKNILIFYFIREKLIPAIFQKNLL